MGGGAITKNSAGQNGGGAYGTGDPTCAPAGSVVSGNKAGQKGGGAAPNATYVK